MRADEQQTAKNPNQELEDIIAGALENLCEVIEEKIAAKLKVYLIALSRKMPRIINWYLRHYEDLNPETQEHTAEIKERLRAIIDKDAIYASEIAIPLLFNKAEDLDRCCILVLDDIVLSGDSISSACDDVYYLTDIKPEIWCIYAYERAPMPENASLENIYVACGGLDRCQSIARLRELAQLIRRYELPTDIEYPMVKISYKGDSEKWEALRRDYREYTERNFETYTIPADNNASSARIESYNVLINGRPTVYANDFSKLRFFHYTDEIRLALFTPNVINIEVLRRVSLFNAQQYRDIWKMVLERALQSTPRATEEDADIFYGPAFEMHREKLLMVFANYLFSLSSGIRHFEDYINDTGCADQNNQEASSSNGTDKTPYLREVCLNVEEDDLAILVGRELASEITQRINNIINNHIVSTSVHTYVNLPDMLVPEPLRARYNEAKYNVMTAGKNKSVQTDLTGIFRAAYDTENRFAQENEPLYNGFPQVNSESMIQETIQGLLTYLSTFYLIGETTYSRREELEKDINEWLDIHIDSGEVIPRYIHVGSSDGRRFRRRYFHASHLFGE